ncbi:MAG TPA: glycoside hydrolase family 28 protein [Lacunisphaera sp.]|nr:glycoside hydrolase family 28 protein [Lacunisphaera sp.]
MKRNVLWFCSSRLLLLLFALAGPRGAAVPPEGDWMSGFKMPVVVEPRIPARSVPVTEFGALPDGRTLCTDAIAKGIEALAAQGGGRLVFPAGIWLTGPIVMKSNVALHLEEGALLQFSTDLSIYRTRIQGLIQAENAENIAFTGPGVIDGGGDAWRPVKKSKMTEGQWKALLASGGRVEDNGSIWYPRTETWRPRLMHLRGCKRVLLEGTTFQNSPGWNIHPAFCDDVTIRNATVRNPWYSQNGDGIDLDSCRNVVVRGTRLDVGDDALCLKSGAGAEARRTGRATENVLIEDCIVYHGHGGFTIGSEMSGGVRNVRVNNCVFMGTDIGLRFKTQRGRGGVVEDIYISNIRMTKIPTDAISFNMYYGGAAPEEEEAATAAPKAMPVDEGTPQFRNIYMQDIVCRGARRAVQLQGLPEMPIRGIHLRNVAISATQGVICQDAEDITLQGVEILNTSGSTVEAVRSRQIDIDRLAYPGGVESVFKLAGVPAGAVSVRHTDLAAARTPAMSAPGTPANALVVK